MKTTKTADAYFREAEKWSRELAKLRAILGSTALTEEVKWGGPCYTYRGKNVVGIGAFKSYFGLWFHQGALLEDDARVLVNAQQGKTRAQRQWRMQSAKDIRPRLIKRYVREAMGNVDAGVEIKAERSKPVVVPDELGSALRRTNGATAAFRALRKGQQREYADYIRDAKRADTRKRRIDRILPMIGKGVGLNDKYR